MVTEQDIDLARKVARRMGSRWSAVETEDLTSELILWLYENAKKVGEYRSRGDVGKLTVALRRVAAHRAVKEEMERTGGMVGYDSPYSVGQIERALPYIFEGAPDTVVAEAHGHTAQRIPTEHGLGKVIILDMRNAFEALTPDMREALTLRFRDGLLYKDIGILSGITDRGASQRVTRAIESMRDFLSVGAPPVL